MTQLELFPKRGRAGKEDAAQLLALLADGRARTRRQIAADLCWRDERRVRNAAVCTGGKVARAPGVSTYRLTRTLSVDEWQSTYGAAIRSVIKHLQEQLLSQEREVYGNKARQA